MGTRIALVAPNWSPHARPEQSAAVIYDSVTDTPLGSFFGPLQRGGEDGEYLLPEECASLFLGWLKDDARTYTAHNLEALQDQWLKQMHNDGWDAP